MILLCSAVALCSCSDGGGGGEGPGGGGGVTQEMISAKWNVSGQSDYTSFEFNKSGNYIVVAKPLNRAAQERYYFGAYTIGEGVVTMSGFGKLTVTGISGNDISFTLELDNDLNVVSVTASKQAEKARHAQNSTFMPYMGICR